MRNWLKLAALVAVAFALGQAMRMNGSGAEHKGKTAPSFELPDLDGRTLDLAALRGKVVAVNFWATWCGPCSEELPALGRAWREGQGQCQEIVGVTEESAREDIAAAVKRFEIPYPVVLDVRGEVARNFGVTAYPRTYIVDAEGRIQEVFTGKLSQSRLEEALARFRPTNCSGT